MIDARKELNIPECTVHTLRHYQKGLDGGTALRPRAASGILDQGSTRPPRCFPSLIRAVGVSSIISHPRNHWRR